jgi:hypothetical protein
MAAIRFTAADRDDQGFIKTTPAEPRSLADLLPTPQSIQADARQKPTTKGEQAMMMVALIGVVVVLVLRFGMSGDAAPQPPASAPAPPQRSGDATATPSPIPATPAVMLPAYAAPNGAALGQIEATRAITPTAHYSSDWIQADVQGSGLVWLRAADWPRLTITGPDLAPRPTATARPYVPPTPEPEPPCLAAGVPGKMVEVCGWGDLAAEAQAKWLATYGGNPGIVTTPTPQEWSKP